MSELEKIDRLDRAMKHFQRLSVLVCHAGKRLTLEQSVVSCARLIFISNEMQIIASQPTTK